MTQRCAPGRGRTWTSAQRSLKSASGRTTMLARRGFLAGSAAAVLSRPFAAAAQNARVRAIDVHAHWYPPEWLALIEKEAGANGARIERTQRGHMVIAIPSLSVAFQPQYTDIGSRLAAMDKAGVAMHALSLTQPMIYWAPAEFGLKL